MGIGVHYGEVVLGMVGNESRMSEGSSVSVVNEERDGFIIQPGEWRRRHIE